METLEQSGWVTNDFLIGFDLIYGSPCRLGGLSWVADCACVPDHLGLSKFDAKKLLPIGVVSAATGNRQAINKWVDREYGLPRGC